MCSRCVWGTGNHGELGLANRIKFSSSPSPIPHNQRYETNTDSSRTHSTELSMIRIKIERRVCCQPTLLSLSFPSTFCLSTRLSLSLSLSLLLSISHPHSPPPSALPPSALPPSTKTFPLLETYKVHAIEYNFYTLDLLICCL